MFGYATKETKELMPLPITLAKLLTNSLIQYRKTNPGAGILPDGKAQVSVKYQNGVPVAIDTVVLSSQHTKQLTLFNLRQFLKGFVKDTFTGYGLDIKMLENTKYHLNPAGTFHVGGSISDAGLTGRKIIVDTYGGSCPHGGGAFSGKDPTKVDRSAAYAARYVAKNLVAAGACEKATLQIAYAIGVAKPVSIYVDTHGTANVDEAKIIACVSDLFDLTPKGIMEELDLLRPIYRKTAAYGHFGREDEDFTWEKTSRVEDIKSYLGL
jgi:S-adenosylmethionine synthetase